jgi:hypothetical protein
VELIQFPNPGSSGTAASYFGVVARKKTAADGTFSFDELKGSGDGVQDTSYQVVARLGFEEVRQVIVRVSDHRPTVRVSLLFGAARIHGVMHDVAGKPLQGARVMLMLKQDSSQVGNLPLQCSNPWDATDTNGGFKFAALPAGGYSLTVTGLMRTREQRPQWGLREYDIDLAEGDDFALGRDGAILCSRFHGAITGAPLSMLARGASVELEREDLAPSGTQWRARQSWSGIRDGFDFYVEPGDWQLTVSYGQLEWNAPDPLWIEGADFKHDIVIPEDGLKER